MMKKALTLLFGTLLVASTAAARDFEEGMVEIAGRSSAAFVIDLDQDNALTLGADAAYYVMPEVGVGGFLDFSKVFGDSSSFTMRIGPQATYNYSIDDMTSLYARAGLGYLQVDPDGGDTASGWTLVAAGGAKYFLTESFSLNGELSYRHDGGDFGTDVITAAFGISVYYVP